MTQKQAQQGQFFSLVRWHVAYLALCTVGIGVALAREGFSASLINNGAWALLNAAVFAPFIRAAFPTTRVPSVEVEAARRTTPHYGVVKH